MPVIEYYRRRRLRPLISWLIWSLASQVILEVRELTATNAAYTARQAQLNAISSLANASPSQQPLVAQAAAAQPSTLVPGLAATPLNTGSPTYTPLAWAVLKYLRGSAPATYPYGLLFLGASAIGSNGGFISYLGSLIPSATSIIDPTTKTTNQLLLGFLAPNASTYTGLKWDLNNGNLLIKSTDFCQDLATNYNQLLTPATPLTEDTVWLGATCMQDAHCCGTNICNTNLTNLGITTTTPPWPVGYGLCDQCLPANAACDSTTSGQCCAGLTCNGEVCQASCASQTMTPCQQVTDCCSASGLACDLGQNSQSVCCINSGTTPCQSDNDCCLGLSCTNGVCCANNGNDCSQTPNNCCANAPTATCGQSALGVPNFCVVGLNQTCVNNNDCARGLYCDIDATPRTCVSCIPANHDCSQFPNSCCSGLTCNSRFNLCQSATPASQGGHCTTISDCLNTPTSALTCDLNTSTCQLCGGVGSFCNQDSQCCDGISAMRCDLATSTCFKQIGEACTDVAECSASTTGTVQCTNISADPAGVTSCNIKTIAVDELCCPTQNPTDCPTLVYDQLNYATAPCASPLTFPGSNIPLSVVCTPLKNGLAKCQLQDLPPGSPCDISLVCQGAAAVCGCADGDTTCADKICCAGNGDACKSNSDCCASADLTCNTTSLTCTSSSDSGSGDEESGNGESLIDRECLLTATEIEECGGGTGASLFIVLLITYKVLAKKYFRQWSEGLRDLSFRGLETLLRAAFNPAEADLAALKVKWDSALLSHGYSDTERLAFCQKLTAFFLDKIPETDYGQYGCEGCTETDMNNMLSASFLAVIKEGASERTGLTGITSSYSNPESSIQKVAMYANRYGLVSTSFLESSAEKSVVALGMSAFTTLLMALVKVLIKVVVLLLTGIYKVIDIPVSWIYQSTWSGGMAALTTDFMNHIRNNLQKNGLSPDVDLGGDTQNLITYPETEVDNARALAFLINNLTAEDLPTPADGTNFSDLDGTTQRQLFEYARNFLGIASIDPTNLDALNQIAIQANNMAKAAGLVPEASAPLTFTTGQTTGPFQAPTTGTYTITDYNNLLRTNPQAVRVGAFLLAQSNTTGLPSTLISNGYQQTDIDNLADEQKIAIVQAYQESAQWQDRTSWQPAEPPSLAA